MEAEGSVYVQVARTAIARRWGEGGSYPPPVAELRRCAACFVSLHLPDGALRGCIGTLEPRYGTLMEEVEANARQAAFHDPRFAPLQEHELQGLQVSVDVLSPPEEVESAAMLDPAQYGVVVVSGGRLGVLLPNLEGIDSVEQQLNIARRKAGIAPQERIVLYRFRVERYF